MKLLFLLQWHIHIKNSQYEPVFERDHSFSTFTKLSFVTNISYLPDTHTYMFVSGCKKYCFSENFANTLNQWFQIIKHKNETINRVKIHFSQNTDTLFYMLPNLPFTIKFWPHQQFGCLYSSLSKTEKLSEISYNFPVI